MTSVKTPKPPTHPPFDAQFEREESSVRSREGVPRKPRQTTLPPPADVITERTRETMAERAARIEQKIERANALLRRLSLTDPRARLVSSAIMRRDEVLLDAVLAAHEDRGRRGRQSG